VLFRSQKLQVNVQKTEKRPVISGFASAGLQNRFDLGAEVPGLSGAAWDGTVSAGLSIQMGLSPHLPWSKETAGVEKSTAELQRLSAELHSLRNAAALEAGKVLLSLSESRAKIEAGEKARELAEELYLASKDMYVNGLITSMEYGDAVMGLSDSRAGWLTYIYDYRMALCDLMDAVGAAIM
jgi:outer membrane protein TolC